MNYEVLGRIRLYPERGINRYLYTSTEENHKKFQSDIPTKILTEHFPNKSLQSHCYINLLDKKKKIIPRNFGQKPQPYTVIYRKWHAQELNWWDRNVWKTVRYATLQAVEDIRWPRGKWPCQNTPTGLCSVITDQNVSCTPPIVVKRRKLNICQQLYLKREEELC